MNYNNLILGIASLLIAILIYKWYIYWRKGKARINGHNKLEAWDYNLFVSFWGVIIILAVSSLILIIKGIFNME
jgi:hypothetical protein